MNKKIEIPTRPNFLFNVLHHYYTSLPDEHKLPLTEMLKINEQFEADHGNFGPRHDAYISFYKSEIERLVDNGGEVVSELVKFAIQLGIIWDAKEADIRRTLEVLTALDEVKSYADMGSKAALSNLL